MGSWEVEIEATKWINLTKAEAIRLMQQLVKVAPIGLHLRKILKPKIKVEP